MSAEPSQDNNVCEPPPEEAVAKRTSKPREAKGRSMPPSSQEALELVNDIPDTESDDETFNEEEEESEDSEDDSSDTETLVTSDDEKNEPPAKKPRSTEN